MSEKALLTSPSCGGCASIKRALKKKLDDGSLRDIPVSTEEGRKIAKELKLGHVPECIEIGDDGSYKTCSLEDLLDEADDDKGAEENDK
jgi:hypothetical protein